MNRRELFTAFMPSPKSKNKYVRPPYTDDSTDFSPCKSCNAPCVENCETKILFINEEGFPSLSFSKAGCSYCGVCAQVCPEGVISEGKSQQIRCEVFINPQKCSAWHKVLCFSCKEPCLDNAIRFEGLYKPVILNDRCTSCGFCVSVCPSNAIEVKPNA